MMRQITIHAVSKECQMPEVQETTGNGRQSRAHRGKVTPWSSFLFASVSLLIAWLFALPMAAQPSVSGSETSNITDKQTTTPFDNLGISSSLDVTVTISFPAAQGTLSPLQPFFTQSGNTYTLDATNDSGAEAFLKTLVFTPAQNRVAVDS